MHGASFDFDLPDELIAQEPPDPRGASRLLVLRRETGVVEHSTFVRLPELLRAGDLLVLNDTRVFPARLIGRRVPSGGAVECLLLRQLPEPDARPRTLQSREPAGSPPAAAGSPEVDRGNSVRWEALMHPGQKLKPGARVLFERGDDRLHGEVLARHFHGRRTVRLWSEAPIDIAAAIDRVGHIPLPPYIRREGRASDRDRYQTVFARERGSVAAPTAGLHFTRELLDALDARGVERTEVTLHVGYGTFKPVRTERVEEHTVDPERFTVPASAADALTRAHRQGRRIIAVGTTTTRTLESLEVREDGVIPPAAGETRLFIHPGHEFRLVRGLVTNFHLPRSSLLMLVAAFGRRDAVLAAYREAVAQRYRFYSYGDAMLIT
jgi:S-adenosylmethionine:tRNA ribosyltransferase-isomerase